ncbi:hypothetical protein [Stenotrophomonas sp.]|uniref:hypothetical protein n=1 Tax=Stenotrophomonas sp. TaxID=69392 RepID=UPI0028A0355B|nr:hypothetical protein [Stenotrophomonas sp.]
MAKLPFNPTGTASHQNKPHTADKLRNDKALWKDHDMSDAKHTAKPEDYERPPTPARKEK